MIKISESYVSCGVDQFLDLDLQDFKDVVAENCCAVGDSTDYFRKNYWYVFSDNMFGAGKEIAKTIKKHKLGKLVSTGWSVNPNTGNKIQTWLWRYNGKKPQDWKRDDAVPYQDYGDDDY